MNTPVSFELANLLKENGFESKSPIAEYWNIEGKQFLVEIWEDEYDSFHHEDCPHDITFVCLAPNIAEVIMWLNENHGIWTVVNVNIMGSWYFEHFDLKEKRNAQFKPTDTHYDSPTEAYEAAIEYTLKNLL